MYMCYRYYSVWAKVLKLNRTDVFKMILFPGQSRDDNIILCSHMYISHITKKNTLVKIKEIIRANSVSVYQSLLLVQNAFQIEMR